MIYCFASENIKIESVIKNIEDRDRKYKEAKLYNETEDEIVSSFEYIKLIESIIKSNDEDDLFNLIIICLKTILRENEGKNIDYFINLLLKIHLENLLYKAISNLFSSKLVGAHIKTEKKLVDAILFIGDINLFVKCDKTQANKWYKLMNKCKFHFENIIKIPDDQGLFNYSINRDMDNKSMPLLISLFDRVNEIDNDLISIKMIDSVYKYYFMIKKKIASIEDARDIFNQMLSIVNNTIPLIVKEIKMKDMTEAEKIRMLDLCYASYDNVFVPYISYVKESKKDAFNILKMISDSNEHIDNIKRKLLINKSKDIDLAYYTNINSFSYMLPYRNKDKKTGMLPLMNISYMNDPTEGTVLYKYLNINKDTIARKIATLPHIYIKSFTSLIDYLPMWEMYADKGKGLCVVLDWKKIKKEKCELYRICYVDIRGEKKPKILIKKNIGLDIASIEKSLVVLQSIRKQFDAKIQEIFDISLQKIAYLFKDGHYYSENESRVLIDSTKFDDGNTCKTEDDEKEIDINKCPYLYKYSNFVPYIKEIIIGPKFNNADYNFPFIKSEIEKMCDLKNYEVPKITYSDIDYR